MAQQTNDLTLDSSLRDLRANFLATSNDDSLIVLGGAILMGIIWIPYGWAADDPVGLKHAIGRGLLSYVAFVYVPSPYKATGIPPRSVETSS